MQLVADQVSARRVADVGCDHGKVVAYLFQNNLIDYAICTDISAPSVAKAEHLLTECGVAPRNFDIRCGDGLHTVTSADSISQVIMSGLGGNEMRKIIKESTIDSEYILQPQNNEFDLKMYLVNNGYHIFFDKIVHDMGKFYNVFVAKKAERNQTYTDYDLYFGRDNFVLGDTDFVGYLDYLYNKNTILLDIVPPDTRQKIDYMLQLIDRAKKEIGE